MKTHRVSEATLYGVKTLDDQHQRLFNVIEKIAKLAGTDDFPAIEALVEVLRDLLATHFSDEERLMIETGYSNAREHRTQHRTLLAEIVRTQRQMLRKGRLSKRDAHDTVDRVIRHMLLVDGPFKTHLQRIGYRAQAIKVQDRSDHALLSGIVSQF